MQKNFSYPVKIDELNQNTYRYKLKPDTDELEDIRQVLQVEDVKSFSAEVALKFNKKENMLRVWGTVSALIVLQSVISLENFEKSVSAPFELWFDTKATYKDIKEMEQGINDDVPDIVENGEINLADICIEQIALCLDDYPRAEGEVFDFSDYVKNESSEVRENPFAILEKLKK
ncbi:MAG: DUF177 domain-containing protein [Alphaproteobacteria bacterium]|nr:DUF177 domain-containing protein [Alphaproteobacteria bacterium]